MGIFTPFANTISTTTFFNFILKNELNIFCFDLYNKIKTINEWLNGKPRCIFRSFYL